MAKNSRQDLEEVVREIYGKLDSIEEYTRLMLISSVADELAKTVSPAEDKNIVAWLETNNLNYVKHEVFNGMDLYFFSYNGRGGVRVIKDTVERFRKEFTAMPVSVLQRINSTQRSSLREGRCSYWIPDKELQIYL